jgi:hypothetical protein
MSLDRNLVALMGSSLLAGIIGCGAEPRPVRQLQATPQRTSRET